MKEIAIKVCNEGDESGCWEEKYTIGREDPEVWAKRTIDNFNNTLHPGESCRVLLGVRKISNNSDIFTPHDWDKSCLTTLIGVKGVYDTYVCKNCGITGKRYGLSESIIVDSRFSGKVYTDCAKSAKHIKKLKELGKL